MIINVRKNIFETNSSSMHSVSVISKKLQPNEMVLDEDGILHTELGEFGWGYDEYFNQATKLSYLVTIIAMKIYGYCINDESGFYELLEGLKDDSEWIDLVNMLKERTGCKDVVVDKSDGYIDHQSFEGTATAFLKSIDCTAEEFIFGDTTLIIDNDNH